MSESVCAKEQLMREEYSGPLGIVRRLEECVLPVISHVLFFF